MLRACALKYGKSWDKSLHTQNSHITIVIKLVLKWHWDKSLHTQNSHITIVIRLVLKWHHLMHSMDDDVEHYCSKVRLERVKYLVQKY
jgi:hypothetical protein